MDDQEMERQLRRLEPEVAELVHKVRSGELPAAMLADLLAELEDLGRCDGPLSAALERLYDIEQRRNPPVGAEASAPQPQ